MLENQNLTLVVMDNGGTQLEPYSGSNVGDGMVVFAQQEDETPLLLDLRLRESLRRFRAQGAHVQQAVLVWDSAEHKRDILRRTQLLARTMTPGSTIALTTSSANSTTTMAELQALAETAKLELGRSHVTINVFIDTARRSSPSESSHPRPSEEAPLTAAWRRIQKHRSDPPASRVQTSGALDSASSQSVDAAV